MYSNPVILLCAFTFLIAGVSALYNSTLVSYTEMGIYTLSTLAFMYIMISMPMSIIGYAGIVITQIWCLNVLHMEYSNYVQIARVIFVINIIAVVFGLGEYAGSHTVKILTRAPKKK